MGNLKYALISVYDKSGIVKLAKVLDKLGYKIISTGGTAKILTENKIQIIPIEEITNQPESFDGRMKTISFQIESGILFDRSSPKHVKEAKALNIKPIDVVVCNLYPFEEKPGIETIDVGGPTMIRAAAKNYKNVLVITNQKDYKTISELLQQNKVTENIRKSMAAKAFAHLSFYDSQIANFFNEELFPKELTIPGRLSSALRYGENPHQQAVFYHMPYARSPLKNLKKISGRDLSATNLTDINAGLEEVHMFETPAAVVIKHNNPCGIALGKSLDEALERAIEADAESAFGGTIVLNKEMTKQAVKVLERFKLERKSNIDIVAAPALNKEAIENLKELRKSLGIYTFGQFKHKLSDHKYAPLKFVEGGFILQTFDNPEMDFKEWKIVTKKKPTQKQIQQMQLAWKFISRIKSNAVIVVDKDLPMTRGIGTGQTSRVRATKIALEQAKAYAKDAILASDSFFPFADSVELASKMGISAIIQQGGSVNDQASIDAADKAGVAMIFTSRRAFWH